MTNVYRHKSGETSVKFGVKNERGVALIVALVMLTLLTMIGTFAITTSTTELKIASNYRFHQVAYYNADRVEQYGPNNPVVRAPFDTGGTSFNQNFAPPANAFGQIPVASQVNVELLCISRPGQGMKTESGADMGTGSIPALVHYRVQVIGIGPNNAQYTMESEVVEPRNVPSSTDFDC